MLTDIICALIGMAALRKAVRAVPGSQDWFKGTNAYEVYCAWGEERSTSCGAN